MLLFFMVILNSSIGLPVLAVTFWQSQYTTLKI